MLQRLGQGVVDGPSSEVAYIIHNGWASAAGTPPL